MVYNQSYWSPKPETVYPSSSAEAKKEKIKTTCILTIKVTVAVSTIFTFLNLMVKFASKSLRLLRTTNLTLMGLSFMGGAVGMGLSAVASFVFAYNQSSPMFKYTDKNLKETANYLLKNVTFGSVMGVIGFTILPMVLGAIVIGSIYAGSKSSFSND